MPATTSQRTESTTAKAIKNGTPAVKAEPLKIEAFSVEMLKTVETSLKGKSTQIAKPVPGSHQVTSAPVASSPITSAQTANQSNSASNSSAAQKDALPKQAPASRMVQTADQWKKCSKP